MAVVGVAGINGVEVVVEVEGLSRGLPRQQRTGLHCWMTLMQVAMRMGRDSLGCVVTARH